MRIAVVYNVFNDEYDVKENSFTDWDCGMYGICMNDSLVILVGLNYLIFTLDSEYSVRTKFSRMFSELADLNIDFTRITKLLEPLIKEIFATRDISQMIQLHKCLLPLLDRVIFTQRIVDNYEIPQVVVTKSARN